MSSVHINQSKCAVHSNCKHAELYCYCSICWTYSGQCKYAYHDERSESYYEQRMDMVRPANLCGQLPENNEFQGDSDIDCPEEIYSSTGDEIISRRTGKQIRRNNQGVIFQEERELYPQLFSSEGTTPYLHFSFPDSASRDKYISNAKQHFESVNTKYSDRTDTRAPMDIENSLLNRFDMDSNGPRECDTQVLQSTDEMGSNRSNNEGDKPHTRIHSGRDKVRKALDFESMDSDEPRMRSIRKRTRSKSKSTSSESSTKKKRTRESPSPSTSKEKTTAVDAKKYWTFILHKQYQSPNWKSERAKGQQPNFISIDHGDHYHIIFECANDGNVQRSRKRIAEFLGSNIKGIAEATFTCTKIKLLVNFVLYCLRYGIRSLNKYGTKIMPLVKTIEDLFETNEDEVDSIDLDAICKPYVEENKEMRKKRMGKNKSKTVIDVITDLIEEYGISSHGQWQNKIPGDTKRYLLNEYGLSVETYIKHLLKIKKDDITYELKSKSIIELLLSKYSTPITVDEKDMEIINWVEYWMSENNIKLPEILAWTEVIRNKLVKKINGLVLEGPTNAGKSLFIRTLTDIIKPEEIPRENDNSAFKLDQLPTATSVIFEEPLITPNNVGTWKLLLEGSTVTTDIKNNNKEKIPRLPIFITMAHPIDKHVDNNESSQIHQRIKIFKFKQGIKHFQDSNARTAIVASREIGNCPGYLTDKHFFIIYLKYWEDIKKHIDNILKDNQPNREEEIRYPDTLDEKITCYKESLLK